MSISGKALEAAARAYFENCEYAEWVRIDEQAKAAIRTDLRAALEAALPIMLREQAEDHGTSK